MTVKQFEETTKAFIRNMPIGLWRQVRAECELEGLTTAQGSIEAYRLWLDKKKSDRDKNL